ncbi:AMP-binding protein [Portibacter marinus]|uniref:AMP-binding protein n=1 Tax=Portibacter marinus TaxID=2898660 RepID=UPI001F4337D8|nr:AMP-binding protein [Portibacter marinus]
MSFSEVLQKWVSGEDFIEIKTSGSTGQPKTIRLSKSKIEASARMSLEYFDLKKGEQVLLALPTNKIGGFMLAIRAIIGGLKVLEVVPKLNPLSEIVIKEEIAFCSLTPAQLNAILIDEHASTQLRKVKKVLLGGSDISPHTLAQIEKLPNTFYHSYGMTETISHVAVKNLSEKQDFFHALRGVSFAVQKDSRLFIHASKILDEPLLTNDLAIIEGSKKMKWIGRSDHVINSGGVKLIVEEIEKKIRTHYPGEFYLTKESHPILGEQLVMVAKENIAAEIFKSLSKLEIPKSIFVTSEFQYSENGKLLRLSPQQLMEL